jgi:2-methylcitrate dehydratase PrpD
MLEGEVGFVAALVGEAVDWSVVTKGLGEHYNITDMTQKNHGCCGHTFAAIDAAIVLRELGATVDNIAAIEVQTYQTAINVTGNHEPTTAFECKFSLPYVVCHAFRHGAVRLAAFDEQAMSDPQTRALMKKLTIVPAPDLTATFPKQRAARVIVTLKDGRQLTHFAPHRKGDPEAPLSDEDLNDKFLELVSPVLGDARAKVLMEQVWSLDRLTLADLKLAQA